MTIGDKIRARRHELGLSVDQLATRLGKNRATVYRYENGDIENLPLGILTPLAAALETTEGYLIGSISVSDNYLTKRRRALGLTQKEIAEMVDVSEATVSRWESGEIANMRRDRIVAYAKALKVTPNFIITGNSADNYEASDTVTLGERIRQIRIEQNMTQQELAELTGYTDRSSIAKIEKGEVDLSQSRILSFAQVLNTTSAYLMGSCEKNTKTVPQQEDGKTGEVVNLFLGLSDEKKQAALEFLRFLAKSEDK